MNSNEKVKCEFILTDRSEGLSMKDMESACFSMFPTPIRFPENSLKFMSLEEFILNKGYNDSER